MGEREIALLHRENSESQKRVFDLPAVTAQVGSGGRDEDLGVLGHASILCNALGGVEQNTAMQLTTFPSKTACFAGTLDKMIPFVDTSKGPRLIEL
jgi:hypothetical protein